MGRWTWTGRVPGFRAGALLITVVVWALALSGSTALARKPGARAAAGGYPPIGAAIDTAASHAGGGYEIEVGGNCLANQVGCNVQHFPYSTSPVQLLVLNRTSLQEVEDLPISGSSLDASLAELTAKKYDSGGYLVVLAALPGNYVNSAYGTALNLVTNVPQASTIGISGGWAAIGVPTKSPPKGQPTGVFNPGSATDAGRLQGELRGYLQQSLSTGNFSFVTGRYVSYNTHAQGSAGNVDVIRVGSARYTLTLPDTPTCDGGYALVVVNGYTLRPVSQQAVATNCPGRGQDQAGIQSLNTVLAAAANLSTGSELVFMQSIGNPFNPGSTLQPLADDSSADIEALGGSAEIWNRSLSAGGYLSSGNSGYAMAGSVAIRNDAPQGSLPESYAPQIASVLTGQSARLQGLLRSDSDSNYVPVTGAAVKNIIGPSLATIVYGASAPWPTGATPGQQGVLKYISNGMRRGNGTPRFVPLEYSPASSCYDPATPDVRFEFCDLARTYGSIRTALGDNKNPPASCGCTTADWSTVRDDLLYEISLRSKVTTYMNLLGGVFNNGPGCTNALVDLYDIAKQIRGAVTVSNDALIAGGRWDSLVSDSFNVLSALAYTFAPEEYAALGNILNDVSATGYLAGDGFNFAQNGNSLASEVSTTAAQLGPVLQKMYCSAEGGLGRYTDVILTDYGKLTAAGTSPNFQINSQDLTKPVLQRLQVGAERFIYDHLMPVAYKPYAMLESKLNPRYLRHKLPSTRRPPSDYICGYEGGGRFDQLWYRVNAADWTSLSLHDPPSPWGSGRQALALVLSEKPDELTDVPPTSIMNTITGSLANGGLGETKLEFFLHNFQRYGVVCGNAYTGPTIDGPSNPAWP